MKQIDELLDEVAQERGYADFFQIDMTLKDGDEQEIERLSIQLEATQRYYKQGKFVIPDPYVGDLNQKRISAYKDLGEQYNLKPSTVRDIFCEGIDWYIKAVKNI